MTTAPTAPTAQTTGTSAQRDENRLTALDRAAIADSVAVDIRAGETDPYDMRANAIRAIGCRPYDLRDSEDQEIVATAAAAVARIRI